MLHYPTFFFCKWWNESIPTALSECNISQHQISFPLGISLNSTMYCLYTFFPCNMLTQGNKQDKALASFAERFESVLGHLPWLNVIRCLYLRAQQGSLLKPFIIFICSELSIRSLNGSLKRTRRKIK